MRPRAIPIAAAVAIVVAGPASAADHAGSGYAGQQTRAIKALSEDDIAALRNGEGMGFAKAAELNGYPGPRHALDLGRELGLSEAQQRQVTAVWDRMNKAARSLGAALIEREAALDQLFGAGGITAERLSAETAAIGELQARLRAAHLLAHLETRALLSPEQVAQYNRLRVYDEPGAPPPAQPGAHRH